MTDFLVKLFVKDYEQINDAEVRSRYGVLSSIVGITCNLILFIIKCVIGMLIHSISVTADAFNNLSDASSSIISFIGVRMARKPADEDHPFGHGRIEYITAFIIACVVIQVGLSLFQTAVTKIFNPEQLTYSTISVIILIISIIVKLWMGLFNRKLGNRIQSKVMTATAADSIGDAVTTFTIIISILVFGIWKINIDGYVGVFVSIVVFIAGINIAKETLAPLIGEAIDPQIYRQLTEFVESYEGILGTHDLIVHNYGPSKSMASIHAEVPNDVDIQVSHEIIDKIERDCIRNYDIFLVIHMDPVETKDERVQRLRNILDEILLNKDPRLSFHDFRVVQGSETANLIFDLVIPRDYDEAQCSELKEYVRDEFLRIDTKFHCIITLENSYCVESEKLSK